MAEREGACINEGSRGYGYVVHLFLLTPGSVFFSCNAFWASIAECLLWYVTNAQPEGRKGEREGEKGRGRGREREREPQQCMVRRWTWNVPSITPLSKQYYTYSMQTYTTPEYTVQAIKSTRQVRTFIHLVCTVESSKCAYTNTTHSSTPSQPHCCQLYKPPPHN